MLLNFFMPLIKLYSYVYFYTVHYIFQIIFLFKKWQAVSPPNDDLLFISATKAAEYIRNRDLKCIDLLEAYIQRINEVNPQINALVMDNFVAARDKAKEIDDYLDNLSNSSTEYAELSETKPLLGVPFTVKNNVFVEGFVCTAGIPSRMKIECCKKDAEIVHKVKKAGGILLGISNVPELGLWWETSNKIFGITRNPYDLRRTAGGSSGGEGALISSAASLIGLGNDVGGSLRIPPAFCGIYGLKPSPGLIPAKDNFPEIAHGYAVQMATAGPMCRYAEDLSIFLKVLVDKEVYKNELHLNEPVDFKKLRFFFMDGLKSPICEPLHNEIKQIVRKVAKYFQKKFDKTTHRIDLVLAHFALEMFLAGFDQTNCSKIAETMVNLEYSLNCYVEAIKLLFGQSEHTVPAIFAGVHSSFPPSNQRYIKFVESKREQLRREILDLLGDNGILIFPSFPTTAPFINQPILTPFNFIYCGLWNAIGVPAIICPMGLGGPDNIPLSIQIIAAPNQERLLLACARELEEGFGGWVAPTNERQFY